MTALVPRHCERTFSGVRRLFTGLPRPKTHEAERQDFSDFIEMIEVSLGRHAPKTVRKVWSR